MCPPGVSTRVPAPALGRSCAAVLQSGVSSAACHRSPTGRRARPDRRQRDQARGALCGEGRMMTRICCLVTDRMTSHDHRGHPRRHATLVILVITRKGDQGRDRPDWRAGERPPAPYSPFDLAGRPTGSRVAADELNADVSTGSVRWVADPTRHAEPHVIAHFRLAAARCRRLHSRDPRHSS